MLTLRMNKAGGARDEILTENKANGLVNTK